MKVSECVSESQPNTFDGHLVSIALNRRKKAFSLESCYDPLDLLDPRQVWQVLTTSLNTRKAPQTVTQLKTHNVIKFGKVLFKVLRIQSPKRPEQTSGIPRNNWMSVHKATAVPADTLCRICYTSCVSANDPLTSVCKCQGSLKYTHISCIRKWLSYRVKTFSSSNVKGFIYPSTQCEVCLSSYMDIVVEEKKEHWLFNEGISMTSGGYVLLEQIPIYHSDSVYNSRQRLFYFLDFSSQSAQHNAVSLGRNRESHIRIKDPTISREHAVIYYDQFHDGYFVKDLYSKFGSFLLLPSVTPATPATPATLPNLPNLAITQPSVSLNTTTLQATRKLRCKYYQHKQYLVNGTLFDINLTYHHPHKIQQLQKMHKKNKMGKANAMDSQPPSKKVKE